MTVSDTGTGISPDVVDHALQGPVEIHPHWQINRKHVELRGCWGSRFEHFHRAVALAARFGAERPWREMAAGVHPLSEVAAALRAIEARTAVKAIVSIR